MALKSEGNKLKRAVKWISEQKEVDSSKLTHELISKASLEFDLNPKEVEYLLRNIL